MRYIKIEVTLMDDVFIRYIRLPSTVQAVTVPDENADYNIYVNKNLCFNQVEKAIEHELEHIRNGDFEEYIPVAEIEKRVKEKLR